MNKWFNIKRLHLVTIPAAFGCYLLAAPAVTQDISDVDQLNRRARLQQTLTELESTLGRHHPALVESLVALADSDTALTLYSEASASLDRAIQIQRFNDGLFTAKQVPLYFAKMATDIRGGDWDEVNESLDYVGWLLTGKNVGGAESMIDNLIRLGEFHLAAVAGDAVEQQADHYRQAQALNYMALRLSELIWGQHDLRRLDLHYSLIKHFYLQSAAVKRGGDTGYALRAIVPGSTWVRPPDLVQSRYYRAGLRQFDAMGEILAESSESSVESQAMLDLYMADWHLLFNETPAETAYTEAYNALREAGHEPEALNRFFSRPRILPVPNFHPTVSQGLAAMELREGDPPSIPGVEVDHYYQLQEWFDTMPVVPFPVVAPALAQLSPVGPTEPTDIWVRFHLDSMNRVSRWVRGTFETHRSVVREFDILKSTGDRDVDADYLDDRLHRLHFRPTLVNGVTGQSEGVLLYRVAP